MSKIVQKKKENSNFIIANYEKNGGFAPALRASLRGGVLREGQWIRKRGRDSAL